MDKVPVYLLKQKIPADHHSGFDIRLMHLCPFLDEVFYVDKVEKGTSGKKMDAADCPWPATRIDGFDAIGEHVTPRLGAVWIAADYPSFLALKKEGVQRIIYDNCDSRALYFFRRMRVLSWKRWKKKLNSFRRWVQWLWRERMILRHCTVVVVPALKDKECYLRHGQGQVEVIENGTDWVEQPPITMRGGTLTLMFHGVFSWEVNVTTAEFLLGQLYPALKKKMPDCKIRIAGHPVPQVLKRFEGMEGVFLEGFVDDLHEWLSECSVYVMPMFQGGGVKCKLYETMSAGLPIVTNSMGAEAMPPEARKCFVVADGCDAMVEEITGLLTDQMRASALAASAREYAVKNFAWEQQAQKYRAVVLFAMAQ